ncbi:MAG: hypothetical protein GF331_06160 [Chitinivibrionales bacterium]|nr:hypothetical protein [Chitinivibrionales bacterium]
MKHGVRIAMLFLGMALPAPVTADVLVDDMEGQRTNQAHSGGYWFIVLDAKSHAEANSQLLVPSSYNFRFHSPGYHSEHCAAVAAVLGAGYRYPFVGMGMNLSRVKEWYDFTRVSAVEFMARGRGVFKLKLRDHWSLYNGSTEDRNQEYSHEFRVDDIWRRYVLPIDRFTVSDQSTIRKAGLGWEDVGDSIQTFIFVSSSYQSRDAGMRIELQVDNIVIRGLDTVGTATGGAPAAEPRSMRTVAEIGSETDEALETSLDEYQ